MTIQFRHALFITAASVLASSAAYATETGPYVSVGVGVHVPTDATSDANIPLNANPTPFRSSFDTGFIGIGSVGYKWDGHVRTELEAAYRQSDFNKVNGTPANGIQKGIGISANIIYDFDNESAITPYLGVGFGISSDKWKRVATTGIPSFNDRSTAFQWQGIAGASMQMSPRVGVFVDYRYINSGKHSFDSQPSGSRVGRYTDESHNVLVGLRFALYAPRPAPVVEAPKPMAQAAPPPPPPPPPPKATAPPAPLPGPSKFIVFFDYDRSSVQTDAQKIVEEAADYAKKNGKAVIHITGHADTSGSVSYNMSLSERRAKAVKATLSEFGISGKEVDVKWKGEADPLNATGDGVKDPQNRRVEIILE